MMKKRKLVCGILACAMAAIPMFGNLSVSAAEFNVGENYKPDGWGYWRASGSRDTVMDVVNDVAYSGSSSIRMNSISGMSYEEYWLTQKPTGLSTGQYTLSFMVKGDPNNALGSKFRVNAMGSNLFEKDIKWIDAIINNDNDGTTKTDMGDGWYRITFPVDASSAAPAEVMFSMYENNSGHDFYIDDISLTLDSDATNTNVLTNASFERYTRDNTLPDRTFPKSFKMEYSGENAEQLFDTNNYFTVSNGVSYTGNNSLKLNKAALSNIQYRLHQDLSGLEKGNYTLSVMVKGDPWNTLGAKIEVFGNGTGLLTGKELKWANTEKELVEGDWYKISYAIDASSEAPTHIQFEYFENNSNTVFYIDDITLTRDDDASKTNLIANGGFESAATMPIDTNPVCEKDYTDAGSDGASLWKATLSGTSAAAYSKVKATVTDTSSNVGTGETALGTTITTDGAVSVFVVIPKISSDIRSVVVKGID